MLKGWEPPPVTVDGKSLRLRDFVSWMTAAPVVSEKAKQTLEPLIGEFVEFLPLTELRGQRYFAVNVLKFVDCLDQSASKIVYSPSQPKEILTVTTYGFIPTRLEAVPIFKLPNYTSVVLVRQPFVDVVVQSRLTGAKFADPSKNPWPAVLRRESCNVVPGVLE
jgi:hypothetical protein